jgi:hypothetical protein
LNHFVTNQYLHMLASTADVIIEQRRLFFFDHVTFRLYQNMAQPVVKLLWHVPQGATMRRGQGNRTTWVNCGSALVSKILLN